MAAIAVLPNKYSISLSEEVPAETLKTPEPEVIFVLNMIKCLINNIDVYKWIYTFFNINLLSILGCSSHPCRSG